MANEVLIPGLAAALEAIGNAHVYKGSFITANSVVPVGQKLGRIDTRYAANWNQLRAEEFTGPMVHDEQMQGEDLSLTIPITVPADGTFWAANSPSGTRGIGHSTPQTPVDTSVVIIPDKEVGGGLKYAAGTWTRLAGNGISGGTGAGVAPKNALWIWRARLSYGEASFDQANGGLMVVPVTVQAKYANLPGLADGYKLATWGDPSTIGGPTGFTFGAPT
jgi:hypothetical protein